MGRVPFYYLLGAIGLWHGQHVDSGTFVPLFVVSPEKEKKLFERIQALGVREKDLDEPFVRSSGAGGQKVNKASTCVVLHHSRLITTINGLNREPGKKVGSLHC